MPSHLHACGARVPFVFLAAHDTLLLLGLGRLFDVFEAILNLLGLLLLLLIVIDLLQPQTTDARSETTQRGTPAGRFWHKPPRRLPTRCRRTQRNVTCRQTTDQHAGRFRSQKLDIHHVNHSRSTTTYMDSDWLSEKKVFARKRVAIVPVAVAVIRQYNAQFTVHCVVGHLNLSAASTAGRVAQLTTCCSSVPR